MEPPPQGAFYGGLLAMAFVTALGVTAIIRNIDQPFLHSSASDCNCIVNVTTSLTADLNEISNVDGNDGLWSMIYKVSYMYYSMIGTGLTVFFGLVISKISDMFTKNQILKITSSHDVHEGGFNSHGHFSVASFTVATGRKLSSFIHHVAHDVSQSTLKVENKLKEVILLNGNLHQCDVEGRISILLHRDNKRLWKIVSKVLGL